MIYIYFEVIYIYIAEGGIIFRTHDGRKKKVVPCVYTPYWVLNITFPVLIHIAGGGVVVIRTRDGR